MNIRFADTEDGSTQDRLCSILVSLSMLADDMRHKSSSNGCTSTVYHHEMEHHYQRAILDTLRFLQISTHGYGIATSENVERICQFGHLALVDIIESHIDQFDTEVEE